MTVAVERSATAAFRSDGFVVVRRVLDEPQMGSLTTAVEEVAEQVGRDPSLGWKGWHESDPRIWKAATAPSVLGHVRALLGPDIAVWGSNIFWKAPGASRSVGWHQDAAAWPLGPDDTVTLWIAIDASTPENGCLLVHPGSHRAGRLAHEASDGTLSMLDRGLQLVEEPTTDPTPVVLEPGDASIHHARLVHGSAPNRSATRRCGIAIRYMPPWVRRIDQTRWPAFQPIPVPRAS